MKKVKKLQKKERKKNETFFKRTENNETFFRLGQDQVAKKVKTL